MLVPLSHVTSLLTLFMESSISIDLGYHAIVTNYYNATSYDPFRSSIKEVFDLSLVFIYRYSS